MHGNMDEYVREELMGLSSIKAIHFKDSDLKISTFTKWRVVERQAAICLPKSNVLVHPDGLSFAGT